MTDFDPQLRDPWRCQACNALIHNIDSEGRPAPGAPLPKYATLAYDAVCSMCHGMSMVIGNNIYFKRLHETWLEKNKGLSPDGKYFPGSA
jgi:hypothetical protein